LINDVLDLAKVEAGKSELCPETFSLAKSIEEVSAVILGLAQKKRVNLGWAVAPELTDVFLDQGKLKQICFNLLSNAVKFTDAGGDVRIEVVPGTHEEFEVRVSDTGIGIKEGDMSRLFREFEQLDSGHARRFEGTGLGLALTKKLVELQGGRMTVQSELGKGSVFTAILPLQLKEAHQHAG
jgi:signal transduction histidine kinase